MLGVRRRIFFHMLNLAYLIDVEACGGVRGSRFACASNANLIGKQPVQQSNYNDEYETRLEDFGSYKITENMGKGEIFDFPAHLYVGCFEYRKKTQSGSSR